MSGQRVFKARNLSIECGNFFRFQQAYEVNCHKLGQIHVFCTVIDISICSLDEVLKGGYQKLW